MKKNLLILASLLLLNACGYPTEARPDHRVLVTTDAETGRAIAISRPCPVWHQYWFDGLENHSRKQFGCANEYNLGQEIEQPYDLVHGRAAGHADAAPGILGIERYRQDKTTPLINPKDIPTTTNN